ncbi:hypothetical protein BN946_scf184768.g6 [Trametes cinnabarina]|uniref:Uncharacterized protein n=1 Tax=Pycnoporus cinnabarinus TaxID=5643 RepID=A0A060SUL3_PYCCI|nr:hypothetical protein BN946_scf184768.g6 [Trametes cinnabarina]
MPPKNKAIESARATRPAKKAKNTALSQPIEIPVASTAKADTPAPTAAEHLSIDDGAVRTSPSNPAPVITHVTASLQSPLSTPPSSPLLNLERAEPFPLSPSTPITSPACRPSTPTTSTQATGPTSPLVSPTANGPFRLSTSTPSGSPARLPSTPSTWSESTAPSSPIAPCTPAGSSGSVSIQAATLMSYDIATTASPSPVDKVPSTGTAPSAPVVGIPNIHPNDVHVIPQAIASGIQYVPEATIVRLRTIATFKDIATNRYGINTVPRTADWGRQGRTEKTLCINNKPALIWIVGRVRSMWFFDRHGEPHLRVNIGFDLPFDLDRSAASDLYNCARPRPQNASAPEVVYAAKICSHRGKGELTATPTPFTNVYDARECLTAKASMPVLSPVDVDKNDIVLVECHFTRWKTSADGKAKKTWTSFDVGFELQSICLLYSAPDNMLDDDGPADDIADIAVEL